MMTIEQIDYEIMKLQCEKKELLKKLPDKQGKINSARFISASCLKKGDKLICVKNANKSKINIGEIYTVISTIIGRETNGRINIKSKTRNHTHQDPLNFRLL